MYAGGVPLYIEFMNISLLPSLHGTMVVEGNSEIGVHEQFLIFDLFKAFVKAIFLQDVLSYHLI